MPRSNAVRDFIRRLRALGARSGGLASLAASAIVHATALGCLTWVALPAGGRCGSGGMTVSFEAPVATEMAAFDAPVPSPLACVADPSCTADEPADDPQLGTSAMGVSPESAPPIRGLAATNSPSPLDFTSPLPAQDELALSALGTKLGKGPQAASGHGTGSGVGEGSRLGPQFFDLETTGTKVVYVLDRSESMQARHAAARNRLERVKSELIRSIGDLAGEMEFFVIFFNHNTLAMPAEKLQPATLENKRKYLEWCTKMKPGGSTDPRDALQRAFDLQPDVIYLLTDGDFSEEVTVTLRSQNTRGVPIHTICIGNAAGERQLKEIARQHQGTFKFVQ